MPLSETHTMWVIALLVSLIFFPLDLSGFRSWEEMVCLATCEKQIKQSLLWGNWPVAAPSVPGALPATARCSRGRAQVQGEEGGGTASRAL